MTDDLPGRPNRRVNLRANVSRTATVLVRHNDAVQLTIETISIGGAGLVGPISVSKGTQIQVLFEFDGHPLDVRSEVIDVISRSMNSDRIMIRFVDLDPNSREVIRAMVLESLDRADEELGGKS